MNKENRIDLMGIPVDALTMEQTINRIDETIRNGEKINHVVVNAGKMVRMQTNMELRESVVTCDLINADGQSIVWAARWLGLGLPERVAGIDLMEKVVELSANKGYKCYFFGATEDVVSKVVNDYTEKYGPSVIAGYRNGYYEDEEEPLIAQKIADSGAQVLFVAMPSPKKENFMYRYREELKNVNFNMGVGGSFDVISGYTSRAPLWMQKRGLEWMHRTRQEPAKMWRRNLRASRFILLVIKAKFRKKKG
jgi:N-acetylglucosaminyldiphosphoundecaprenol N-acetyl-beta-D-mannosaminyltransferase